MHHRLGLKHDAASVWLEDVSASSFKICLRELQNFAGVHDEILVVSVLISMQTNFFARLGTHLCHLVLTFSRPEIQTLGCCLNIVHITLPQQYFSRFSFRTG